MSKFRKILFILFTVVCVAFSCFAITACTGKTWRKPAGGVKDDGSIDPNNPHGDLPFYYPEGVDPTQYESDENAYVINTVSMGGMPIDNVHVTVSKNGQTVIEGISQNGGVKFGGIDFQDYDLSYDDLPQGYHEDEEGTVKHLTADTLKVTTKFNSSVIVSNMPSGWQYSLGDVMYNFSYTDHNGWTVTLSELLQTKKAVILNFWATWCSPCASEFPALNSVYNKYKNDIEVIALSIDSNDNNQIINTYKNSKNLDFFMANDNLGLGASLGGNASVPTTVIIDRYGVVAFHHVGTIPSSLEWEARFKQFLADDYTQNPEQEVGGDTGDKERVAPPEFIEFEPISNNAFNQAFLDASMEQTLNFYGPADGTNDAKYNWPFQVYENSTDGMYIAPSNIGTYTHDNVKYNTDYTWSILYTDLTLEADETLSVDVKLNTESESDILYIIMNHSSVNAYKGSGETNGWVTIELYKATRPTQLNISIMYDKNTVGSPDNEFVGLKNLKITKVDYNSPYPLDLRTEVAVEEDDGSYTYKNVYLADDGFYHVNDGEFDSILFTDIMFETQWSDHHISGYSLFSEEGNGLTVSLYNISFWLFGKASIDFGYGSEETSTILECFYVQDVTFDILIPVTADVRQALEAFVQYAFDNSKMFGNNVYKNGHNENTWLELCSYFRTYGDHKAKDENGNDHVCKAHTNPGKGRVFKYAIDLVEGVNQVDTTIATSVNFAMGAFYKLEAFKGAGVYRIKSTLPYDPGNPVDPYILVWPKDANPYIGNPMIEQDESVGVERFTDYSYNFEVFIYLKEGDIVYPQITTRSTDNSGKYNVEVEYIGKEYWQFRFASTADGVWFGVDDQSAVYAAITTVLSGPDRDTHYHVLENGDIGSVVYIDFIHKNFYDQNGNTIKDWIDHGAFKISNEEDYTPFMSNYYEQAIAKDEDDPTYGMIEATDKLVRILSSFLQADSGDGIKTGIWKAFAYYYQYYGSTAWKDMIV